MGIAQNSHPRGQTPQTSSTGTPLLAESGPALMRTPKGMRMAIGLFGRRNVGKSSVLNAITNQETSIVSAVAGTTADPVDKPMELLPLGPVLFVDTAGIDDDQETVGELRTQRTKKVFDRHLGPLRRRDSRSAFQPKRPLHHSVQQNGPASH